jgi:hypothetical protein
MGDISLVESEEGEITTLKLRGKGGKERVRSEKSKNVHAFVIGRLLDYCEYPCDDIPNPPSDMIVTYNPYRHDSFVYKQSEEPVYRAEEVDMINSQNKLFVVKK